MHAEAAEKPVQTKPAPTSSSAIHQEVHNTWGPRLGATANNTFNQSYAHQYDGMAQAAVNSVKHGLEHLLGTMTLVGDAAKDACDVFAKDAKIQMEKVTDPNRADLHEAELSKQLHELRHKYAPVITAVKQAHAAVEHDLEDIGFNGEHNPRQYARLVTDPANIIGKGIDSFTAQSPAAQIDAIGDQVTQIAGTGLLGKATEVAGSALRLTEAAAKFDALFAKMEQTKLTFGQNGLKLEGALTSDGSQASDGMLMAKGKGSGEGVEKPSELIRHIKPEEQKYLDQLPQFKKSEGTQGLFVGDGHEMRVDSGREGFAKQMPKGSSGLDAYVRTHSEGHAVAFMIQNGIKEARIYINNPAICPPCEKNLHLALPYGSKLEVVLPDGTIRTFIGDKK